MNVNVLDRQFIEAMIHGEPIEQIMEDIEFMDDHLYNIFNQIRIQFPLITTQLGITTRRQREAVLRAMIIAAQNGIMDFHQIALDTINVAGPSGPSQNPGASASRPRSEEQPRRNVRRRLMPHREESSVTDEDFIKNKPFDSESECYICYESLNTSPACMIRECGHVFHCHCINRWRLDMHKDTCPTCRGEIIRIIPTRTVSFGNRVQKKLSQIESDIKYLNRI